MTTRPDLSDRHPGVRDLMRHFEFGHLPEGPLRATSAMCSDLAWGMVMTLPDSPQLTNGLWDLLRAKDCFVRAALPR